MISSFSSAAAQEQVQRVGVLLNLQTYSHLAGSPNLDEDCLVGLSLDELNALASCKLAFTQCPQRGIADQSRLDDLVERHTKSQLNPDEEAEMDELLTKADQLTILKTRARYTLKCLEKDSTAA